MLVDSKDLSQQAKVWIYPSSRKFYLNEIDDVEKKLREFIKNWKKEDHNFRASYRFLYSRFLIFIADDEKKTLTNTDIDTLVSFILKLQTTYNVQLLDKMNACFKQGEFVQYKELKDFKSLLKSRAITKKTIIFDNLISTKQELEHYWEIPIEDSWYSRFL